ncbi:cytochrome c oxidase assembly protein [Rhodoligotrophos defluvii]|uniref:cytochrome c oxidase assembly protein n=1 Tax=Rhodoligotrophos defluvii TaxID=2561934 RepID=UPI0010C9CE1A
MTGSSDRNRTTLLRSNGGIAALCIAVVVAMVGLSYAAVPLYQLFCQVTGYGGATKRADAAPASASDRTIKVRFDANVAPDMPWRFEPVEREIEVKLGEQKLTYYRATNLTDRPVVGMATYNVTPGQTGYYFNKISCFCFNEQVLQPGETVDMPVLFFVDPELAEDEDTANVHTITLSYTFFRKEPAAKSAAAAAEGAKRNESQSGKADAGRSQAAPNEPNDMTKRGGAPVGGAPVNTGAEGHG